MTSESPVLHEENPDVLEILPFKEIHPFLGIHQLSLKTNRNNINSRVGFKNIPFRFLGVDGRFWLWANIAADSPLDEGEMPMGAVSLDVQADEEVTNAPLTVSMSIHAKTLEQASILASYNARMQVSGKVYQLTSFPSLLAGETLEDLAREAEQYPLELKNKLFNHDFLLGQVLSPTYFPFDPKVLHQIGVTFFSRK